MPEDLRLRDVFMSEFSATRGATIAKSSPVARVTLSVSEVQFISESLAQVGTKFEVAIRGAEEENPYCDLLSEYVVRIDVGEAEKDSDSTLGAISDFAMDSTFANHRERILEATLRMGIPLFRMPLSLREVEEKAASDEASASA